MRRLEAIRVIVEGLSGDELLVHANGAISRESLFCQDRRGNFYLLGSMGLASSVALGVALSRTDRRVVVLDGDGNLLMGLGNLALIGALKPPNLVHVVLDNEVYGTTGDQPTLSPLVPLYRMAEAAGYRKALLIHNEEELREAFRESLTARGPVLLQVKVSREVAERTPRIPYSAREIKERFRKGLVP